MITADAVRKYLSSWGYLRTDFYITENEGRVLVTGTYPGAPLRAAAHHLKFCEALDVDDDYSDHIWVTVR